MMTLKNYVRTFLQIKSLHQNLIKKFGQKRCQLFASQVNVGGMGRQKKVLGVLQQAYNLAGETRAFH